MLQVQLPRSEFSLQPQPSLPKPFLSGIESIKLASRSRPVLFQKQKIFCIRSRIATTENVKSVPVTPAIEATLSKKDFPSGFYFGTASSAYQYEGAAFQDGKGESNWDHFCHTYPEKITDRSNGDVAVDAYHRYKEDIAMMKDMGVNSYRFSIAWTRILPNGKLSGGVNKAGVQYYNNLIDELLANGIQPFVTLFHWDVPQALEDEFGGFLSREIVDHFRDYADVCFREFGDRVKDWITLNEPWTFIVGGYVQGTFPPPKTDNTGVDPYVVAHHLLLAHATAVELYRKKYQATQQGKIGIALNYFWMVPFSDSPDDKAAAQRASDFMFGWFMEPITSGEYPKSMRDLVGSRLPRISEEESNLLRGSSDFLGLNYYTANYAKDKLHNGVQIPPTNPSYTTDSYVEQSTHKHGVPIGKPTSSSWLYVYPEGMREILVYIKETYHNPVVYVSENGISDHGTLKDEERTNALQDHLKYLRKAIEVGVDVKGFFVWSFLDNFEWNVGYMTPFGINHVDFDNGLKRTPKESAYWLKDFLKE